MRTRFSLILAAGAAAATLGASVLVSAPPAAADDPCIATAPGANRCSSPGHTGITVQPRTLAPAFRGYYGWPYYVYYWR